MFRDPVYLAGGEAWVDQYGLGHESIFKVLKLNSWIEVDLLVSLQKLRKC